MVWKLALRFCRAAGKCGVVFQTVILRQVAEGETVGKEQGVARSVVCNGLVLGIQALQLGQIVLGILRIDLCEAGIQAAKLLADNPHDSLGVAQGKPYVLVVFGFGVAAVLHQAFQHLLRGKGGRHKEGMCGGIRKGIKTVIAKIDMKVLRRAGLMAMIVEPAT